MTEEIKKIITEQDQWLVAEGENDNAPFILRYRPFLQPFIETHDYNVRLIILLSYESDTSDLLPSNEQFELFQKIEDNIVFEVETDLLSILAFVYTGSGQREWHFYTRNVKESKEKINSILNKDNYSGIIELQEENDPDWEEYHKVLSGAMDSDEE